MTNMERIDLLNREHKLDKEQWIRLFSTFTPEDAAYAAKLSREITDIHFGKTIFFRGIVEKIHGNPCI